MKTQFKSLLLMSLSVCALFGGSATGNSQITVKVDSTKPWQGYMNRFDLNNAWIGGQPFGLDQLRGNFVPNLATATRLILQVNTNTYNPADPFWTDKNLEANCYVDVGFLYAGQEVTFVGTVESNTIPEGWTCEAVIKEFNPGWAYVGDTRVPVVAGAFSVTRAIAPGRITQYGFLTYGTNAPPGSAPALEAASIFVDNSDLSVIGEPVNQRVVVGGTATFNVVAVGGSPLSYKWQRYSTNLVNAVGKFSGATSATLNISNAQFDDATAYSVIVTDLAGSVTNTAQLMVVTADQFSNWLDNPGFELNVVDPTLVPSPWINFSGSALVNTNDGYAFDPNFPVQTVDGTNAVKTFNAGEYNGIYQDVPASPGDIFTGDGQLYMSSLDLLLGDCEAFLEVQFRQGAANPIAMYGSAPVTPSSPTDTWLFLQVTNGVAAGYAQTTTVNAAYLVAPEGTDHVRYQLTLHNIAAGSGNVYLDATRLMKKIPVTVTTSVSGGNITLSWLTQGATGYEVVYKDDLNAASWTSFVPAEVVAGDGTVKSKSFPTSAAKRFYNVLTK